MITGFTILDANGPALPAIVHIYPEDGSKPSVGTNQEDGGGGCVLYPAFEAVDGILEIRDLDGKHQAVGGFLSKAANVTMAHDTRPGAPAGAMWGTATLPFVVG